MPARFRISCVVAWLLACQQAHLPDADAAGREQPDAGGGIASAGTSATAGSNAAPAAGARTEALEQDRDAIFEVQASTCEQFIRCFFPLRASFASAANSVSDIDLRPAQCRAMFEARYDESLFPALQESVAEGRVIYRPEQLEACATATAGLACPEFSSPPTGACAQAFEGTVEIGGRCTTGYDCRADAYCDLGLSLEQVCPATCKPRLREGSACRHPAECVAGLRCFDPTFMAPATMTNTGCFPPATQGAPCHGQHCAEGLICTRRGDVLSCEFFEVEQGPGEPCTPTLQCADGAACRSEDPMVEPVCVDASEGATCSRASECQAEELCACTDASCTARVCARFPEEGEACGVGATTNQVCAQGLFCSGGTCMPKLPLGATCENAPSCVSNRCEDAVCVPPEC